MTRTPVTLNHMGKCVKIKTLFYKFFSSAKDNWQTIDLTNFLLN
jgi:hypothetical protein